MCLEQEWKGKGKFRGYSHRYAMPTVDVKPIYFNNLISIDYKLFYYFFYITGSANNRMASPMVSDYCSL